MYIITNHGKAAQGVYDTSGRLVFIQAGESREIDCDPLPLARKSHLEVEGDLPVMDIGTLRAAYQAKTGKRPFMGWDADTLKAKLA